MAQYIWLDYENRIWFGMLMKELSKDVTQVQNYVAHYLEKDWLITEFLSQQYGKIRKQTTMIEAPNELFKILSALFENLNFRQIQKVNGKLVNKYVLEQFTANLDFAQPYCFSILTCDTALVMLDTITIEVSSILKKSDRSVS